MYNTVSQTELIMSIPIVTSRQEGAAEVRVFMLEDEREQLKQACTSMKTNMSHILRVLALQWLTEQHQTPHE